MRRHTRFLTSVTALGIASILMVSCAGTIMKGYTGQKMPASETALIRGGAYADIDSCDGVKLGRSQVDVTVLPGRHTIEILLVRRVIGDRFLYSVGTASVTFSAEAGHTYVADADVTSSESLLFRSHSWIATVTDKGTYEQVASSDPQPLRIEWVPAYGGLKVY